MSDLFAFYKSRISHFEQILKKVKKRLLLSSMLRLFTFLLGLFFLIFFFSKPSILIPVLLLLIVVFVILVAKHGDLQLKNEQISNLIQINKTEIEVLNGNFSDLPSGEEFIDPSHDFSHDIDLFGEHSFFQYLNRTGLIEGRRGLSALLTSNNIHNIERKQAAIAELGKKVDFRQQFSAAAGILENKNEVSNRRTIFENYAFSIPKFAGWFSMFFSAVTVILAGGWCWGLFPWYIFLCWGVIGFIIKKIYSKRINLLGEKVSVFQNTFGNYHRLLELIERECFSSEMLLQKYSEISSEKRKASVLFKRFSKTIDSFDQRNVFIFGELANIFFLWDLNFAFQLENWIKANGMKVPQWVSVVEYFDTYNSLGNFYFNHPQYVFPKIENGKTLINSKGAGHPLIDPVRNVKNDFCIEEGQFFIITGANMAGKSTFLRTVSLQMVMSNVGLPVCAEKCIYSPIKLITSMRSTDSLSKGASYFYSELSRLKFIVDKLKTDRYFIILDEILKGTNSQDKAIGSRKFVEKLIASQSTGLIATHDLSLCKIATISEEIKNFSFDVEIVGDELHFDYSIREGICKNMNASFLLKKMGIVD
ncbi:MAG TPA: DNA mismatch repair protein MutS [Flavobacteriaceae bacterium]|nr:DNA mismatch repair protein MutS [Flavobacteriaceae bacterium]